MLLEEPRYVARARLPIIHIAGQRPPVCALPGNLCSEEWGRVGEGVRMSG